jgi:ATP-dependent RNA circularization protein (DNA/RNA ligase family)
MVVEEKIDGANCGVSFDDQANLLLQSRGHYLVGGPRERHFNLLKTWAAAHAEDLYLALGERYVMYGEWMYAKHTVFYDRLPHYFMEFDIYDRERDVYLSTARRRELLRGLKIASVAVLWEGKPTRLSDITSLVAPSLFKSAEWRNNLIAAATAAGVAPAQASPRPTATTPWRGSILKSRTRTR